MNELSTIYTKSMSVSEVIKSCCCEFNDSLRVWKADHLLTKLTSSFAEVYGSVLLVMAPPTTYIFIGKSSMPLILSLFSPPAIESNEPVEEISWISSS